MVPLKPGGCSCGQDFSAEMETLCGRGNEKDIGTPGSDLTGFTEKKNQVLKELVKV